MRIVVGSLQCETNTFSPVDVKREDFEYAIGEKIFEKLAIKDTFEKVGAELIPTIYANALPSGKMSLEIFEEFKKQILNLIPGDVKIDGVWLYLHGAMEVEEIGSGEAALVGQIRRKVSPKIPIAVALDFHANNTEELINSSNIICGYRTAPHVDQDETQIRAAELLIKCIRERILPKPIMVRPPLILTGDTVITNIDPMKSLINELYKLESNDEILTASIFNGQPWVDAPNNMASVIVIAKSDTELAKREALRLAKKFWNSRFDFKFEEEAMEPEQAVKEALNSKEKMIFITDSGDNTTAGAAGDNTLLLKHLLNNNTHNKKVLVAGITDSRVIKQCNKHGLGETLDFHIGAELYQKSECILLQGTIKNKGRIKGWANEDAGATIVIDCQGVDIIVTENRSAFITPAHFERAGVCVFDYDIVVVKLGYLFTELKAIADQSILALTSGASCEDISKINFTRIKHPVYPCDKDFEWIYNEEVEKRKGN